jgi:hypothetical protein
VRKCAFVTALLSLLLFVPRVVEAAEPSVRKVLPHLLDHKGRISLAPGLFERDAYQRQLRENPGQVSGVRFDVQWRASGVPEEELKLRVWIRTAKREPHQPLQFEAPIAGNRRWGGWSSVTLEGEEYQRAGEILAWRVVLYQGDVALAEQKSFLW